MMVVSRNFLVTLSFAAGIRLCPNLVMCCLGICRWNNGYRGLKWNRRAEFITPAYSVTFILRFKRGMDSSLLTTVMG